MWGEDGAGRSRHLAGRRLRGRWPGEPPPKPVQDTISRGTFLAAAVGHGAEIQSVKHPTLCKAGRRAPVPTCGLGTGDGDPLRPALLTGGLLGERAEREGVDPCRSLSIAGRCVAQATSPQPTATATQVATATHAAARPSSTAAGTEAAWPNAWQAAENMPSGKTMLHRSAPGGHHRSHGREVQRGRAPGSTGMPRPMPPVRARGLRAEAVRRHAEERMRREGGDRECAHADPVVRAEPSRPGANDDASDHRRHHRHVEQDGHRPDGEHKALEHRVVAVRGDGRGRYHRRLCRHHGKQPSA